ncbi:MAG: aminotransferase class V-fold PLP-dependent enzyme [Desulfobacteraceae bacterium]|nr:aminotransferase class V-fold PLP-dependent enzyme [Desulfobacteraceae bacterium]
MLKYHFFNDYSEGAHPALLEFITESNLSQEEGYGNDRVSMKARDLIRQSVGNPKAHIHFVSGGTQANLVVLASMLKPHESLMAAESAHIHTHEAGAIETTGHKINTISSENGKILPDQIRFIMETHTDEHMVKPRVVFISNSTELGTVYTINELENISKVCKSHGLFLYMDGARLGSALMSQASDLSFSDLNRWVDIYYIGGTKNGALMGEAIVINNSELARDFRYHLKQRGALVAKSRFLGAQFAGLFQNDLYFSLARHANAMADKISAHLGKWGFSFLTTPSTNQIFPILPNAMIMRLQELYGFHVWKKMGHESSAIRLVTSWATQEEAVDGFLMDFKAMID